MNVMTRGHLSGSKHNGETIHSSYIAGLCLTDVIYPPETKVPNHYHHDACFCLVQKGEYTEQYQSKSIDCHPSRLIFRPAEELHSDHFGCNGAQCFIIEFGTDWLTRIDEYSAGLRQPTSFQDSSLQWLAMRILHEAKRTDAFSSLSVEGLMLELFAEVGRGSKSLSERKRPQWLEGAKEILHDNFTERLTLVSIAEAVGVHPVYLAAVFRQYYFCSVGEYVRRLRIEFACTELSRTNAPLVDIALAAGFAHQSHFSRTFKRLTGLTPAQYRAASRLS